MKKEAIRKLVKQIEFVFITTFAFTGWFTGGFSLVWALVLFGGYSALNLTGWANRPLYEARDEIKKPSK